MASVFVSRVDTLVDKKIDEKLKARPDEALAKLRGTAAVAGAKLIYHRFKEIFRGDRFKAMAAKGARVQRPLWASNLGLTQRHHGIGPIPAITGLRSAISK